ncbi:MAG: 4-hydroxy-tetrahydrodipicolinate synthase [Chthonomonadales bacterium]|nr:4-hydroxy-tetrahydrodipicolinate synthase [Chthonomonadales bacterium]
MQADWGQVLTAMVTPFDERLAIDEAGVARLVDHLFANGSDGLVVCGTTGEAPTLSPDEKLRMFGLVKECARGRGPVIAGSGDNETATTIELSRAAEAVGADGLLLVTPYYNKPSQEGLYRHFRAAAEAVSVPIVIYNVPGRTSVNMEPATVARLAREAPNIVAVKEASGNMVQASEIVAAAPEGFQVYSGEDGVVLPLLAVGAVGVISVTSHLVGRDLKAMHAAFRAGDTARARRLHLRMLPIVHACFQSTTPSPVPVKAALQMLGLPAGPLRLPLVEATAREREVVASALRAYGLLA